jgi:hypothetical protein
LHPDSIFFFTFFFNGMFCRSILDQRITKVFCWIEEYEVNEQKQTEKNWNALLRSSPVFAWITWHSLFKRGAPFSAVSHPSWEIFFVRGICSRKNLYCTFFCFENILSTSPCLIFFNIYARLYLLKYFIYFCVLRETKKRQSL